MFIFLKKTIKIMNINLAIIILLGLAIRKIIIFSSIRMQESIKTRINKL